MASEWTVLVFGDSWADYMHPCWPSVLGRRLSAKVFNFANAGSLVGDLDGQGRRALMSPQVPKAPNGFLKQETLVVVHTCGNDFIMKMAEVLMGGGGLMAMFGGAGAAMPTGPTPDILRANPGAREVEVLRQFLEMMHRSGARHFVISGVAAFLEMPIWNMIWPVVGNLVNQGKLTEIGVSPGDPPKLAMEVQAAALHERWESMVDTFGKAHTDSECVFFDEVGALERLRATMGAPTFDRSMWDMSMFHPTAYGHEQIASEAHRTVTERLVVLSRLAPHDGVPPEARMCNKQSPDARQGASGTAAAAANGSSQQPTAEKAAPAVAIAAAAAADFWECTTCTLHNQMSRTVCEACESARPASAAPSPSAPAVGPAPAPAADKAAAVEAASNGKVADPIVVRVRNVKGDVAFDVSADGLWTAPRLKEAVLAAAPAGFAPSGSSCILALKGKFLGDGQESLADIGVGDRTQLIAVLRAAPAKPADAFNPPARAS